MPITSDTITTASKYSAVPTFPSAETSDDAQNNGQISAASSA